MYKATAIIHKGQQRIAVYFERQPQLIQRFKKLEGAQWSATLKVWHLPDTDANRTRFQLPVMLAPEQATTKNTNRLTAQPADYTGDIIAKTDAYKSWLRSKRYSDNTVSTYSDALLVFLRFYRHKPVAEISNQDVITFNNEYILRQHFSASYQNQIVNAIKLFFKQIENAALRVDLVHRPKRAKQLPNVLSKQEVKSILEALNNLKHKAMLSLIYSCGLRCSELIQLRITDIHAQRNLLHLKNAKGKKDRIAPLSNKTIALLREYVKAHRPSVYLFEGQQKGQPYDARSLQLVLKSALAKTTISKAVTLHWLRHSYATHLLESGTDLRYIQEILGHKSSRTTEIYTHVSTRSIQNINSPFDDL